MHDGIAKPGWRGKCSRYSRCIRNSQYFVSGKSPWSVMRGFGIFLIVNPNKLLNKQFTCRWFKSQYNANNRITSFGCINNSWRIYITFKTISLELMLAHDYKDIVKSTSLKKKNRVCNFGTFIRPNYIFDVRTITTNYSSVAYISAVRICFFLQKYLGI